MQHEMGSEMSVCAGGNEVRDEWCLLKADGGATAGFWGEYSHYNFYNAVGAKNTCLVDKTTSAVGGVANFTVSPVFYHTEIHSAPPDVTSYTNNTSSSTTSDGIHVERSAGAGTAAPKQSPKYGNAELMETGDGEFTAFAARPTSIFSISVSS